MALHNDLLAGLGAGRTARRGGTYGHSVGHDVHGVPGVAVEVKRTEKASVPAWWRQAVEQASDAGLVPVLFWRRNRKPWRIFVPGGSGEPVEMDFPAYGDWLADLVEGLEGVAPPAPPATG